MRGRTLSKVAALALMLGGAGAQGQTVYDVGTAAELTAAVNAAFTNSQRAFDNHNDQPDRKHHRHGADDRECECGDQWRRYTLNMNNADRAFFIAGGNVAINDLIIANGSAVGGSGGGSGGEVQAWEERSLWGAAPI